MAEGFEVPVSVFDYGYGGVIKAHRFHEWAQLAQFALVKEAYAAAAASSDPDGLIWVYLKHRSIIHAHDVRPSKVRIRTWLSDLSGNRSMREYAIVDEADQALLFQRSTTSVALDRATLKPTRRNLSQFEGLIEGNAQGLVPLEFDLPPESEAFSYSRTIEPDDIDYNRHVNNTAYLRWIYDAILRREFERKVELSVPKRVRDLQIRYLRPMALGKITTLRCVTCARPGDETDWKIEVLENGEERPAAIAFARVSR